MYAAKVEVLTIDDFPVRKVRHAVEPGSNESRNIAASRVHLHTTPYTQQPRPE